ncbi:hypothetical protein AX14_000692, partial [Amanita brunnescens Koide BX004]
TSSSATASSTPLEPPDQTLKSGNKTRFKAAAKKLITLERYDENNMLVDGDL